MVIYCTEEMSDIKKIPIGKDLKQMDDKLKSFVSEMKEQNNKLADDDI